MRSDPKNVTVDPVTETAWGLMEGQGVLPVGIPVVPVVQEEGFVSKEKSGGNVTEIVCSIPAPGEEGVAQITP